MNVFDKKRKIYNSNEHNSNNNVAKCHILINYWCREYGIDYSSYNRHNNSCIHFLDNNNIKGAFEMTEKRLIQGSYCEQRYLHSDEVFRKERNWNINLLSEREFKNGYCIVTDKEDTAYSIDELVELLNEFQNENRQLKHRIKKLRKQNNDLRKRIRLLVE